MTLIRFRTSCSRPAMADLGEHRRFRHRAQRLSSGRADHSRGPGKERRHRRLYRHLPGAWHFAGIAGAPADSRPHAAHAGFKGRLDPEGLANSRRRQARTGPAKAQEVCVACHGEQGVSGSPEYPHLAGQSGAAIYKQLNDYRTGSRTNPLMTDIAKALDEATLADVAAYYAAQPKRNPNPATLADSPPISCAWSSSAIPAAISPLARPAIGPARVARSRPLFFPSRGRSTLSCS